MKYLSLVVLLVMSPFCYAQLSVSNLAESQHGNLPDTDPKNLSSLYDQLNLEYRVDDVTIGGRIERFQSSNLEKTYTHFSQRYFEWEKGPIRARLGNLYSTLGRGLLLRAFELPFVVFEQRQFRRRYGYYRDIDGLFVEGRWRRLEFTVLHGSPLDNSFPPEVEGLERRTAQIEGGQISVQPLSWLTLGNAYLRHTSKNISPQEMSSFFTRLSLTKALRNAGLKRTAMSIYAEHARINSELDTFFSTAKDKPHATYISMNLSAGKAGVSVEYKDYRGFETGINLPPTLIKEHSYYLLNRSTHELFANSETGYQLELTYSPVSWLFLEGNTSNAKNEFPIRTYNYKERFFEGTLYWSEKIISKTYFDVAEDELIGDRSRKTAGFNLEWSVVQSYGITIDGQWQRIERGFGSQPSEEFGNFYSAITLSKSPQYSLALAFERSTDPAETDDPTTFFELEKDPKYWWRTVATAELNMTNQISVFYGSRRGGITCLSGTCYEVLPFEGIEIRWTTQF